MYIYKTMNCFKITTLVQTTPTTMKSNLAVLFLLFCTCFGDEASPSTDGGQQPVGGETNVDVKKPEIQQLARESLAQYDLKSSNENLHKVVDIKSATVQVVAGTMTRITFEAKMTSCGRVDVDKLETCPILIGAATKICKASIWDRPWLANGKEITINCEEAPSTDGGQRLVGGQTNVDVKKPEIQQLARESLAQYDLKSSNENLHKVVDIKSATVQVVAGTMTRITFEVKMTSCGRVDVDKLETCPILIGAATKICKASIWDRPWLENGKEITINCEEAPSTDGGQQPLGGQQPVGGETKVDVKKPEIQQLARESLAQYDLKSSNENLHKVVDIKSATVQVVAGTMTRITFEAKMTSCGRVDVDKLETCPILIGAATKICKASIWDRPWLENGKEITINCEEAPSTDGGQQPVGGETKVDVKKPEIQQLARESLAQYDLRSNNENLHKVVKIKSATSQVVAGTMTRITFEAKETSCGRVDVDELETCPILRGAVAKLCKASIWDRPWLVNGKEITVDCKLARQKYRKY
ncbi:kininogen-2-like [Arctopsyche grandis]|uniref:kininogen-2-like n=1 Tax=Arctopsyche grandis TaxID=121162 RepID=UPI00406DA162